MLCFKQIYPVRCSDIFSKIALLILKSLCNLDIRFIHQFSHLGVWTVHQFFGEATICRGMFVCSLPQLSWTGYDGVRFSHSRPRQCSHLAKMQFHWENILFQEENICSSPKQIEEPLNNFGTPLSFSLEINSCVQWSSRWAIWQAVGECDDKSEFVVWQIRACGDKSASGAWQIRVKHIVSLSPACQRTCRVVSPYNEQILARQLSQLLQLAQVVAGVVQLAHFHLLLVPQDVSRRAIVSHKTFQGSLCRGYKPKIKISQIP